MVKYSEVERKEARERLLELLDGNRMIFTTVKKVSSSGMYRHISCFVIKGNEPCCVDWAVSRLLGLPLKEDGVGIGGCGMDMGFAIVYDVSRALFPEGDGKTDGGYLVKQRWL